MLLSEAQKNMRFAYFGGAVGLAVSAAVWLAASVVATRVNTRTGILALLVGGMFIFPLSVLLAKLLGRPGTHDKANPLGGLALETTVLLILGCILAYALALQRAQWFFPAMLVVIGGRYLLFQTLYGLRVYWLCGGLLVAAGLTLAVVPVYPARVAMIGGLIEAGFAAVLFRQQRRAADA